MGPELSFVRPVTLSNTNISATNQPIAIKFYIRDQSFITRWGPVIFRGGGQEKKKNFSGGGGVGGKSMNI